MSLVWEFSQQRSSSLPTVRCTFCLLRKDDKLLYGFAARPCDVRFSTMSSWALGWAANDALRTEGWCRCSSACLTTFHGPTAPCHSFILACNHAQFGFGYFLAPFDSRYRFPAIWRLVSVSQYCRLINCMYIHMHIYLLFHERSPWFSPLSATEDPACV